MGFFDIFGQKKPTGAVANVGMHTEVPLPVAPLSDIAPIHAEDLPPMPLPPEYTFSPPQELPALQEQTQSPQEAPSTQTPEYPTAELPPNFTTEENSHEPAKQVHLSTSTLFISVSDYKAVLSRMNLMRTKITDMEHYLARLNAIKNDKDHHLERWCASLEDVEKKLGYADQIIARADG